MTEKSTKRTKGGRFAKGTSGNPNGRPKGSRNQLNERLQELTETYGPQLTEECFRKALDGDGKALQFCSRLLLRLSSTERELPLNIPEIREMTDLRTAYAMVLDALVDGRLTPGEFNQVVHVLDSQRGTLTNWEQLLYRR